MTLMPLQAARLRCDTLWLIHTLFCRPAGCWPPAEDGSYGCALSSHLFQDVQGTHSQRPGHVLLHAGD